MSIFERFLGKGKKDDLKVVGYRVVKTGSAGLREIERYNAEPSEDDIDWDAQEPGNYVCQPIYANGKFGETVWRHQVPGAAKEEPEEPKPQREKKPKGLFNEDKLNEMVEAVNALDTIDTMRAKLRGNGGAPVQQVDPAEVVFNHMDKYAQFFQRLLEFQNPYARESKGIPKNVQERAWGAIAEKNPALVLGMGDPLERVAKAFGEGLGEVMSRVQGQAAPAPTETAPRPFRSAAQPQAPAPQAPPAAPAVPPRAPPAVPAVQTVQPTPAPPTEEPPQPTVLHERIVTAGGSKAKGGKGEKKKVEA